MTNSTLSTIPSLGLPYYSQLELIQDLCARRMKLNFKCMLSFFYSYTRIKSYGTLKFIMFV